MDDKEFIEQEFQSIFMDYEGSFDVEVTHAYDDEYDVVITYQWGQWPPSTEFCTSAHVVKDSVYKKAEFCVYEDIYYDLDKEELFSWLFFESMTMLDKTKPVDN